MIRRNYLFYVEKRNNAPDGLLRFRIRYASSEVSFSLGYRVEVAKWVADAQRVKANTYHNKIPAFEINKKIEKYAEIADKVFIAYEQKNTIPTTSQFRDDFNAEIGKKRKVSANSDIRSLVDEFVNIQSVQNSWSDGTRKKIYTVFNKVAAFADIHIDDFTDNFLHSYVSHLENVGYKNTTIQKEIKTIGWFLRWAAKQGYYSGNAHETFRPRLKMTQKEVIYLTWDELMRLYTFQFGECFSRVRDVFCFCCFSGLRYSDVAKLQKSDISNGAIHIVTKKTGDKLTIELNKYTTEILERYSGTNSQLALPIISNVKMNKYLKELGKIAEINEQVRQVYYVGSERHEEVHPKYELLTTHCGRRTFVVNAIFLGIAPEVIMKWTEHANYESMKPYIAIVDKLKRQEMNKFNI